MAEARTESTSLKLRPINDPVGCWWAAFDNGEVWPVEVLRANFFGTTVRPTHASAPQGEVTLHASRVYDSKFNKPKWGRA
jgi:hypothetical protein